MKKHLFTVPLLLSLSCYAGSGGASDETSFILALAGMLLFIAAIFELPRWARKLRLRRTERKRIEFEKRQAEQVNEENHFFVRA